MSPDPHKILPTPLPFWNDFKCILHFSQWSLGAVMWYRQILNWLPGIGQSTVLQRRSCVAAPRQAGSSVRQVRVRVWKPLPQDKLQVLHPCHVPHSPPAKRQHKTSRRIGPSCDTWCWCIIFCSLACNQQSCYQPYVTTSGVSTGLSGSITTGTSGTSSSERQKQAYGQHARSYARLFIR